MPPNPPEEFSPVNVTSPYTLGLETTTSQIYPTPKLTSKRRTTNPYNSSFHQPTNLNNNNMSTTMTTMTTTNGIAADSPRMDTEFVINGYSSSQQVKQQGPTRKRSFSKPSQEGHLTLSSAAPNIHPTPYVDGLKTSRFGVVNGLQSSQYKSNSLLGKLRQQYEAVEKERVNPIINIMSSTKPLTPSSVNIEYSPVNFKKFIFNSLNYDTVKFLLYCLLWYASSAITNNTGKQLLNQFNYPVTLTWIQFGFVGFYCYAFGQGMGLTRIRSPTVGIIRRTLPLCLFQIGSHVFSSIATAQVPVSFVHTIKALSPLFTVFFYKFGFGVNYSYPVYISLIPLTIGVMLACSSSTASSFIGFLFALTSTVIFVAQNIFSKKILFNEQHPGFETHKLDKLNVSFYSSILAFGLMTPMWLYYDGFHLLLEYFTSSSTVTYTTSGWAILFYFWLNCTTHFAQAILALSILSITSPVTYSIASLVKRIFVITASILWFGQKTTLIQGIGITLTFVGLYMYNKAKLDVDKKERKARERDEIILPLTKSESELDLTKKKKHIM